MVIDSRPGLRLISLILVLAAMTGGPVLAAVCTGFRPARRDVRGTPPGLARPVVALSGDFNYDGVLDVAAVNRYIDGFLQYGSISVFAGDLTGSFDLLSTQQIPGGSTWADLGDFDGDPYLDFVAVNNDGLMVFHGNGTDGFDPPLMIPLGFNPIHVSAAEMNHDGHEDLVVVQQYIGQPAGRVVVLTGDGAGGFTQMAPASVGQSPRGGVVGDFDKDGHQDVIAGSTLSDILTLLPGVGDGTFGPPQYMSLGASAEFLTAADLDFDGNLDLIVTGQTVGQRVMSLRGNGDGTFQFIGSVGDGISPRNPVVCDFDRDGLPDVAVPNGGSSNVSLLFGMGGAALSPPFIIGTDNGPSQASLADFNTDGFCDLVTANEGSDSLSVLLGGVRGTLGTPTVPTGNVPLGAATADFNADGLLDIAVVNRDDNTLSVFRGDGEGGLFLSQTLSTGTSPGSIAPADFNLDGSPDLVVANQGVPGDQVNDTVMIYFNDTVGGYITGPELTVGDLPLDVKTGDFNGDGRPDIVVANSSGDKVTVYYAEPAGQFSNPKNIRVGGPQRSLALADYDLDGFLDIAVSFAGQNALTTLMGGANGGFQKGPVLTLPGTSVIDQLTVADLDADTLPDLVAISQPPDPFALGEATVLLGLGSNTFDIPYPSVATGVRPEAVVVIDLDRDGGLDVIVANRFGNDIISLLGDGQGGLVQGDRFGTGSDPFYLVTGDFNGDARTDIVSVNGGESSLSVLLNNTPTTDKIEDLDFSEPTRLFWSSVPGATAYRVYRDLLQNLSIDNFGRCEDPDNTTLEHIDYGNPPLGEAYFYLLSPMISGMEGPLGYTSECIKRPNFSPCFVP